MGNRIFRLAMRLGWLARAAFVFSAVVSRQSSVVSRRPAFAIFPATLLHFTARGQECPRHTVAIRFFFAYTYFCLHVRGQKIFKMFCLFLRCTSLPQRDYGLVSRLAFRRILFRG